MLAGADKPLTGVGEKQLQTVPPASAALNTNELFARLWVAGFVSNGLLLKPHGGLIPVALFILDDVISQVAAAIT